jgi:hypothetical protein
MTDDIEPVDEPVEDEDVDEEEPESPKSDPVEPDASFDDPVLEEDPAPPDVGLIGADKEPE